MEIVLHRDVAEYAALAGPLLESDPERNTIALTVLDASLRTGTPFELLLTVHERGQVVGAAQHTEGRPLLVSAVPPRCAAAVDRALSEVVEPPGATGPTDAVQAFAEAHRDRTGAAVVVEMRMRLFSLGQLVPPGGVPGASRLARANGPSGVGGDVELIGAWREAFAREAGLELGSGPPAAEVLRSLATGAAEVLWEVDGGAVALAVARPVVAGMSRIGPVYTPPQHRRLGFGAAVTAAASQWALDAGARRVLLFTDLANPASNALYPRLGYRAVHDALHVSFRR